MTIIEHKGQKWRDESFASWYFSFKGDIYYGLIMAVKAFEDISKELLISYLTKEVNGYLLDFENIGSWWNRAGEEIDIVAYNRKSRKILVSEVKWTNTLTDIDVVDNLLKKSKYINFTGEYKFLFISKSGFTERALKRMNEIKALHLDLKDIERMFENI